MKFFPVLDEPTAGQVLAYLASEINTNIDQNENLTNAQKHQYKEMAENMNQAAAKNASTLWLHEYLAMGNAVLINDFPVGVVLLGGGRA